MTIDIDASHALVHIGESRVGLRCASHVMLAPRPVGSPADYLDVVAVEIAPRAVALQEPAPIRARSALAQSALGLYASTAGSSQAAAGALDVFA